MFAEVISSVILIIIIHILYILEQKKPIKSEKFFKDLLQCLKNYEI
jgi:hypothetical protein